MLFLLPHAGKSLHHTCTSSRGNGPASCRALGLCSQAHNKACHARRSCEPSAPRRSDANWDFCHCAMALSVALCRFPATLSPGFRHFAGHFGSYQIRQMPVARSAAELWARTHETARSPRRGKRLIETMVPDLQCQSLSATSKPDRHSGRLDRRHVLSGTEAG
jgi:hypothetical protein